MIIYKWYVILLSLLFTCWIADFDLWFSESFIHSSLLSGYQNEVPDIIIIIIIIISLTGLSTIIHYVCIIVIVVEPKKFFFFGMNRRPPTKLSPCNYQEKKREKKRNWNWIRYISTTAISTTIAAISFHIFRRKQIQLAKNDNFSSPQMWWWWSLKFFFNLFGGLETKMNKKKKRKRKHAHDEFFFSFLH